jgi:hypothetical protein
VLGMGQHEGRLKKVQVTTLDLCLARLRGFDFGFGLEHIFNIQIIKFPAYHCTFHLTIIRDQSHVQGTSPAPHA